MHQLYDTLHDPRTSCAKCVYTQCMYNVLAPATVTYHLPSKDATFGEVSNAPFLNFDNVFKIRMMHAWTWYND